MHHANRSLRPLFTTILCAILFFTSSLSYTPFASALAMNTAGDYVREAQSIGYPQWKVVDSDPKGLKCRTIDSTRPIFLDRQDINVQNPDISKWDVLRTFKTGVVLEGLAGNRVLPPIQIDDSRGKPWIVIRLDGAQGDCLVRANSQFVRPLLPAGSDGWRCRCRAKDCGSRQNPNSFTVEKIREIDPSSSDYGCEPIMPEISSNFGLEENMPYAKARQKLIDQGWTPNVKGTPPNLRNQTVKALFKQGYKEVKDCSGTGLGPCRFEFTNKTGKMLVVSTIAQGQNGPDRFVLRWFIE
jgi:hypothetical protein